MKYAFLAATLLSSTYAAYVPSEPWSTLTPAASAPSGASTDYTAKFGIQIETVSASSSATPTSKAKRDGVQQIGDGQIQKQTSITLSTPTPTAASVINQIGDGQIQHQTTASAAKVINQIGDGQIQHQTTASAAKVINQIGDGQIQHQTTASAASVINQIGDGQIQHQTTKTATTASAVNQIGDGQIQHQTTKTTSTASAVNQIGDGQIQHQTTSTASGASQISDGQVQATGAASNDNSAIAKACATENSLTMTLKGSVLTDAHGRIGAIVANRQFQFDGPPPQAGSIYAAGWSVTKDGYLALGDEDTFYQCASGDFFNLYDQNVAAQCSPVKLSIIDLVEC